MHDPMTQVCQIKYPWPAYRGTGIFSRYHEPIITIWHVDPETDGTDDSCGWFMRSRHGDKATLEAIRKEFEFNWDPEYGGWFHKDSRPAMSTIGIITDMVGSAAWLHFKKDHRKRDRFMRANIWEIIRLAENPTDSMHESVTGKYGFDKREHRIEHDHCFAESRPVGCHPPRHPHARREHRGEPLHQRAPVHLEPV